MLFYLVGFMGVGKSTCGKKLASRLDYDFVDLDAYIENKHKHTVSSIFNILGEEGFRKIERYALQEISQLQNTIVATGGGTPCFFDNMEVINRTGTSVYLYLNDRALLSRLRGSKQRRPLIKDKTDEQLSEYIIKTLNEREVFYIQSAIKVDMITSHFSDIYNKLKNCL